MPTKSGLAARAVLNEAASTLYAVTCKLAYTETRMGMNPISPFQPRDVRGLMRQSGEVADCAKNFRAHIAETLDSSSVSDALRTVRAAQAFFDQINNTVSNDLSVEQVKTAVTSAITAVNGCYSQDGA